MKLAIAILVFTAMLAVCCADSRESPNRKGSNSATVVLEKTDSVRSEPRPTRINPERSRNRDRGCTGDCSGHDAGYEWAERNSIVEFDDCVGPRTRKSSSFLEGCQEYVRDYKGKFVESLDNPEEY